ncbi:HAD-like protein [Hymenopellis radicata]|nr:HAD-like protein [Hymenopellis radicata]
MSSQTFYADAVLFDMDGTLTDSISAVEAAWGKVAQDIGEDPERVIAATHGKRAIDNLAEFKPEIKAHEMDAAVTQFEETILYFADAYNHHGPGSRRGSEATSVFSESTPALTPESSEPSSRNSESSAPSHRPSFLSQVDNAFRMSSVPEYAPTFDDDDMDIAHNEIIASELNSEAKVIEDVMEAWEIEAASVDRSVRILPGVKKMLDSLPQGRYAVATSGAKTYAFGCMARVGITPPPVTITADDKRLKAGKPAPDPFLLAAKCLGYDASKCVVFEDSPSGIRAGVASGATVIAVCTSHERSKIEGCGAHYILENMDFVTCEVAEHGRLKFTIASA